MIHYIRLVGSYALWMMLYFLFIQNSTLAGLVAGFSHSVNQYDLTMRGLSVLLATVVSMLIAWWASL